jgi:hypothetical protein
MPPQHTESNAPRRKTAFEEAGDGKQLSLVGEFLLFMRENKKWWLAPMLVALGTIGLLALLGSTGAAPFIYTLF